MTGKRETYMRQMRFVSSMIIAAALLFAVMKVEVHGLTIQNEDTTMTYGDQLDAIMRTILDKYLDRDDISAQELYEAAMTGMFGVLDQYSAYIPADRSEQFTQTLNNTYVGIGVQLVQEDDYVVVTRVFLDGPAEKAGLIVHDRLIAVDGVSIVGFTPQEAASLIIGDEGTDVIITVDRNGYIFDVTITRGTVVINSVDRLDIRDVLPDMAQQTAEKIGYLRIESFTEQVDDELKPILAEFEEAGKTHLLLDLRDNGGGYVDSAVAVCDMLLPEGPVLRFVNNEGREIVYRSDNESPDFEIVALINDNSASATEFVSKAIQESGQGILVGEKTYGKGVAQYIYELDDGAMFKLTQEEFFSGQNAAIHGIGVTPDIYVNVPGYLTVKRRYYQGDTNSEITVAEEILGYLGYGIQYPDSLYDYKAVDAVKAFQADQGLYSYGVLDLTTQERLNRVLMETVRENDIQLAEAARTIEGMVTSGE